MPSPAKTSRLGLFWNSRIVDDATNESIKLRKLSYVVVCLWVVLFERKCTLRRAWQALFCNGRVIVGSSSPRKPNSCRMLSVGSAHALFYKSEVKAKHPPFLWPSTKWIGVSWHAGYKRLSQSQDTDASQRQSIWRWSARRSRIWPKQMLTSIIECWS